MIQTISKRIEVDPNRGNDQPNARPSQPFKTLTAAVTAVQGNTLITLAPGTYSATTGERFPLTLPDGVMVTGQETTQGEGIVIAGGLVLQGQGQLRGVTVQNPQGVGIAIGSGSPLVRACRLTQCGSAGVQVTGSARPLVMNTRIEKVSGSGIRFVDQARGEVRDCIVLGCQTGIEVVATAAPLLMANQCSANQVGILVGGTASPVLRRNRLGQNQQLGLWLKDRSRPDLGQPGDVGGNVIQRNTQGDLRNDTGQTLISVGNDILPQRLSGPVTLAASQIPDPAAVPKSLLDSPVTSPSPATAPPATPSPATPSPPIPTRFSDLKGHWATPYVEALADRNLVKGFEDGTYRPDQTINRAQFAALVAASYGTIPLSKAAVRFVDVPPEMWAANAIDLAQRRGFLGGYPDQTFRPDQPMARVQGLVAVATGLKLPRAVANVLGVYRDRAQIPSYAIDALASATEQGLVVNYPDPAQLRPQEPMTRAEVAALIYQGLVALGQAPKLKSDVVVQAHTVQGSFPDIRTHWARDFIQGLLNQNLIRGYDDGQFYPDRPMTRGQFAALLNSAFTLTPRRPATLFRDVPPSYWATDAIQATYRAEFLSGFPDQTFGPESSIVRVQGWVAVVNGLALLAGQAGNQGGLGRFSDRSQIPSYALDAVAKATQLKLVVNVPDINELSPNRVASRADISALIYQTLVQQRRLPALASPYIVRP
ncbi:MAG: S-layer homology domain-containing protein [Nodosilinea sp.]